MSLFLFIFNDLCPTNCLKIYRTDVRQIPPEISFSSHKGRCHGIHFLLVLSTEVMGVAGRWRLAQPGGLTLGFALHLVSI